MFPFDSPPTTTPISTSTSRTTAMLDVGLPDALIESVIDEEAPRLLPRVRRRLGLTGNTFIIPSDVHDYLLGKKRLQQLSGVVGGNILEDRWGR